MTLSAIQAFLRGRKEVPQYISGSLTKLETAKGMEAFHAQGDGWYRAARDGEDIPVDDPYANEWGLIPLPGGVLPHIGAACMLGAQAVAMGITLEEFAKDIDGEGQPYFVHPDFMLEEDDRLRWPNGVMWDGDTPQIDVAKTQHPCICPHTKSPWGGGLLMTETPRSVPEVIAHLNDKHDPRRNEDNDPGWYARTAEVEMADLWPEDRIVEWLRGLGYNGDH